MNFSCRFSLIHLFLNQINTTMRKLLSIFLLAFVFTFSSGFGLVTYSPSVHRELAASNTTPSARKVLVDCNNPNTCKEVCKPEQPKKQEETTPTFKDRVLAFLGTIAQKFVLFLVGAITK